MPIRSLSRTAVRDVDRRAVEEYGLTGVVLMENAGRGAAEVMVRLGLPGPVLICCGKGNNAGDGFVIARHLELHGVPVQILLWSDPAELRGDAAANYQIVERSGLPIEILSSDGSLPRLREHLRSAGSVVDALLGTGATGEPRAPLDKVIDALNGSGLPIVAIDLPSGLDCDTGLPSRHTIRAAHTCTFVAYKAGFLQPGADRYTGEIHVVSIGAPRRLLEECLATGGDARSISPPLRAANESQVPNSGRRRPS